MKTVIGLFESSRDAERVMSKLHSAGLDEDSTILSSERVLEDAEQRGPAADTERAVGEEQPNYGAFTGPGLPHLAGGSVGLTAGGLESAGTGAGSRQDALLRKLADLGLDEQRADFLARGAQRGGVIVAVRVPDERLDEARELMRQVAGDRGDDRIISGND